jgi:hypothetical protein
LGNFGGGGRDADHWIKRAGRVEWEFEASPFYGISAVADPDKLVGADRRYSQKRLFQRLVKS